MDYPLFKPFRPFKRNLSPQVVSIPIHFFESADQYKQPPPAFKTPATSALKIQKVVRGYLVRKSLKKIASIRNEVYKIERRLLKVEAVELLLRDSKERPRVNESLMAWLFKLDSVRGVDSGVRDYRKSVIKKAIALQEMVDGIVASGYQALDTSTANVNGSDSDSDFEESPTNCSIDSDNDPLDQMAKCLKGSFNIVSEQSMETGGVENTEIMHSSGKETEASHFYMESELKADEEHNLNCESMKEDEDDCAVKEVDENCETVKGTSECFESGAQNSYTEDCDGGFTAIEKDEKWMEVKNDEVEEEERDDNKRNRELLEKMSEDSEKMMNMMAQIFERNKQQMWMLNFLSQRVEKLEKAFISEKLKKKKTKKRDMRVRTEEQ